MGTRRTHHEREHHGTPNTTHEDRKVGTRDDLRRHTAWVDEQKERKRRRTHATPTSSTRDKSIPGAGGRRGKRRGRGNIGKGIGISHGGYTQK